MFHDLEKKGLEAIPVNGFLTRYRYGGYIRNEDRTGAPTMTAKIKFTKTSIIVNGTRIKVRYSAGPWVQGVDPNMIKVRPHNCSAFPAIVRDQLTVANGSDITTDYFEPDYIRFFPGDALYAAVRAAAIA